MPEEPDLFDDPNFEDPADLIDKNKARYFKTDKGKESQARYSRSPKGRDAQKRYHETDRSRANQERYRGSPKGREAYERARQLRADRVEILAEILKEARDRQEKGLCITCGESKCETKGHIQRLPEMFDR